MVLINSKTGEIRKQYSIEELTEIANIMRGYNLISLCAAGSGHSGGTLSIMDIAAALYLRVADNDPENPFWDDRDRIIWSTGHKAPALYVALGMAGYYDVEDVVRLRKLHTPYQGHPHWEKLAGVEASTGSLGQGLSIAVGIALRAKLDNKSYTVFSINGDGELQEGQIWEAIMCAGHYKLDNLISIVDKNRLQIDGWVKDVMNIDPLPDKFKAFNWDVIEIDGHNMKEVVEALEKAKKMKGKPIAIIAHTIKGKGVSFMENVAGWHGKAPNKEQLLIALKDLKLDKIFNKEKLDKLFKRAEDYQKNVVEKHLAEKLPKFESGYDYWWNKQPIMRVEMEATRRGFGKALDKYGDDERIVCLGADISGSITISKFYENHPERKNRFFSIGIAEQNMTGIAAGLAKEGKLPVIGTYGVFASGRNWDQLRTTVCYGNFNVFVAGAHGGVSVGPDGATHQALEELFNVCALPNMHVCVPCDVIETERLTKILLFDIKGPKYIRFAREATPIVTTYDTPLKFGVANIYKFIGEKEKFIDAFEVYLAPDYKNDKDEITIIACGPMVPEAMRAAWILKREYGIESRVVNMHTVKPLDKQTIIRCAKETDIIVTAEEHQIGGLGNKVASAILEDPDASTKPLLFGMVGVKDRFGESGYPWELIIEFEVSAEYIAKLAYKLYKIRDKKLAPN